MQEFKPRLERKYELNEPLVTKSQFDRAILDMEIGSHVNLATSRFGEISDLERYTNSLVEMEAREIITKIKHEELKAARLKEAQMRINSEFLNMSIRKEGF